MGGLPPRHLCNERVDLTDASCMGTIMVVYLITYWDHTLGASKS